MPRTRPNGTNQSESDHNVDSATDTESPFQTTRRSPRLIAATKSKKKIIRRPSNSEESANEGRGKKRSAPGFDCNICFDLAKEPVVTCCGHLFCWPCLYEWLHVHCTFRECPVCKGSVNESSVVPIYGNGISDAFTEKDNRDDDDDDGEEKQGLKVPPRPQGQRVESFRQRLNDLRGQEMLVRGMRQYLIANEFRLQGLERRVGNNGDNNDNNNNNNGNTNNNNNAQAFFRSRVNGHVAQARNENTRTAAVNDSLNMREQDNSRSQASTSSTMAMIEGEVRTTSDVSLGTNNGGTSMTLRPRPRQRRRWA